MRQCGAREARAHLVGAVVVLRVDLVDLGLLLVVERAVELVDVELFPPSLGVREHVLGLGEVELARAQEAPASVSC